MIIRIRIIVNNNNNKSYQRNNKTDKNQHLNIF